MNGKRPESKDDEKRRECVSVEMQRRQHYHVPIQALATGDCPPLAILKQADPRAQLAQNSCSIFAFHLLGSQAQESTQGVRVMCTLFGVPNTEVLTPVCLT